jgi:hypothetical protein
VLLSATTLLKIKSPFNEIDRFLYWRRVPPSSKLSQSPASVLIHSFLQKDCSGEVNELIAESFRELSVTACLVKNLTGVMREMNTFERQY